MKLAIYTAMRVGGYDHHRAAVWANAATEASLRIGGMTAMGLTWFKLRMERRVHVDTE